METHDHLQAALQHLIDIDQETLSVAVINGFTQEECYEHARRALEQALERQPTF